MVIKYIQRTPATNNTIRNIPDHQSACRYAADHDALTVGRHVWNSRSLNSHSLTRKEGDNFWSPYPGHPRGSNRWRAARTYRYRHTFCLIVICLFLEITAAPPASIKRYTTASGTSIESKGFCFWSQPCGRFYFEGSLAYRKRQTVDRCATRCGLMVF